LKFKNHANFGLHNFACRTAQSEFWTAQIGWTARLEWAPIYKTTWGRDFKFGTRLCMGNAKRAHK